MQTITIDIINEKALKLLRDLESLKLIRVRRKTPKKQVAMDWAKYKGAMFKQPLDEVERQLNELRSSFQ